MNLESLIAHARNRGASDLHLEPGLPAGLRIHGELTTTGDRLSAGLVRGLVREAIGEAAWEAFRARGSWDATRTLAGVRCRINALTSMRGAGLAVRLLPGMVPTIAGLNLHPDLIALTDEPHGLVIVSGRTGCGKSTTLAALLQEINSRRPAHIVTIEQPIEFVLAPDRAFIRQREVGRDTPSFEQALVDVMREDPDVIMLGELLEPETMRLALTAAETGHLVLTTLHSANVAEALQRVILAFPASIQAGVAAQLADCLRAVICQRLIYRADLNLQVPECEILRTSPGVRHNVRNQEWFRLPTALETGGADGQWPRDRYRAWLEAKSDFARPADLVAEGPPPGADETATHVGLEPVSAPAPARAKADADPKEGVMIIDAPDGDMDSIVSQLPGTIKKR